MAVGLAEDGSTEEDPIRRAYGGSAEDGYKEILPKKTL